MKELVYVYLVVEYDTFGYYVRYVCLDKDLAEKLLNELNVKYPHSCGYDIEKHEITYLGHI